MLKIMQMLIILLCSVSVYAETTKLKTMERENEAERIDFLIEKVRSGKVLTSEEEVELHSYAMTLERFHEMLAQISTTKQVAQGGISWKDIGGFLCLVLTAVVLVLTYQHMAMKQAEFTNRKRKE